MAYKKSEPPGESLDSVPSFDKELGTRIKTVLDLYESRTSAARVAGKSQDMLMAYVKGTSAPPFEVLVKLAHDRKVSLDWLAYGDGPMDSDVRRKMIHDMVPIDEDFAAIVAEGIARVYKDNHARLSPSDHGRLTARVCNSLMTIYDNDQERKIALKLALDGIQKELVATPVSGAPSSKRSA